MRLRLITILAILPAQFTLAQPESENPTLDEQTAREQITNAISTMDTDPERSRSTLERIADRAPSNDLKAAALYNNAVLAKRESRTEDALESFTQARTLTTDPVLRRDALDNIAHIHAKYGELPDDQPPSLESIDTALESLQLAERAFLDASRTDPSHMESIRNLQRTRQRIRELEQQREQLEQQQNQQQQQGDQGPQNQNSDQLQQLADQQREQAQQSESAQSQRQSQEQREDRQQQQQDLSEQTQSAQQQMSDSLDEETQQDLERAQEAQQRAQEALEQGNDEQAAQAQQEAADALEQAAQRQREQEAQNQPQHQPQNQQGEGEPQDEGDPRDNIDELAQRLLDKERRERERRSVYRQGGQPVRVEEDW